MISVSVFTGAEGSLHKMIYIIRVIPDGIEVYCWVWASEFQQRIAVPVGTYANLEAMYQANPEMREIDNWRPRRDTWLDETANGRGPR